MASRYELLVNQLRDKVVADKFGLLAEIAAFPASTAVIHKLLI